MDQRKTGMALSFLSIFLKIGVTFVYIPFVLSSIGKEDYGLFSIIGSIVAYLTVLDFGINDSTLRYFVKFRNESSSNKKKSILGSVSCIYTGVSLLVLAASTGIYFGLDSLFSDALTPEEIPLLKKMFLLAGANVFITLFFNPIGAILNAYEKFVFLKATDIAVFLLSTITIVVFLLNDYGVLTIVIITSTYNVLNILFRALYVRVKLKIAFPVYYSNPVTTRKIIIYAGPIFIVVIVEQIYWKLDNIIIGALLSSSMVTFYAMGVVFQKYVLSFSTAISRIITPSLIQQIDKQSSKELLTNTYIKVSRLQLIVVLGIILNLVCWGHTFLIIWLGPEYDISFYILVLTMVPFSVEIIGNLRNTLLQVYEYYWYRAGIIFGISLLNVLFTLILVQKYGIIAAATSTSVSLILGYILTNYLLWDKVGINVKLFLIRVWFYSLKLIVPVGGFALLLQYFITPKGWLSLALVVGATFAVYACFVWFLYLTVQEKTHLKLIFKRG
jgi:O-antigen/teichoic acid export membrane protein